MNSQEIHQLVEKQSDYFFRQKTLPVKNRLDALKKLYKAIKENEDSIYKALKADLGKSEMESYMCEAGLVLSEISYMLKNTRRFAKEHCKNSSGTFCIKKLHKALPERKRSHNEPVELSFHAYD